MSKSSNTFFNSIMTFSSKIKANQNQQSNLGLSVHIIIFLSICGTIVYTGYSNKAIGAIVALFTSNLDPTMTIVETLHLFVPIVLTIILLLSCGILVGSGGLIIYRRLKSPLIPTQKQLKPKLKKKHKPIRH